MVISTIKQWMMSMSRNERSLKILREIQRKNQRLDEIITLELTREEINNIIDHLTGYGTLWYEDYKSSIESLNNKILIKIRNVMNENDRTND